MPLVFFMAPNDPRMLSTIDAIRRPLDQGGLTANGLVYRYDPAAAPDGLPGREGTFNMCSFWLVEALTRAGRTDPARLEDARLLFEQMLGYSNHLGLYAEQTGTSGEALGNFPQAFTHLGLISAAFNLDRALGALGPPYRRFDRPFGFLGLAELAFQHGGRDLGAEFTEIVGPTRHVGEHRRVLRRIGPHALVDQVEDAVDHTRVGRRRYLDLAINVISRDRRIQVHGRLDQRIAILGSAAVTDAPPTRFRALVAAPRTAV